MATQLTLAKDPVVLLAPKSSVGMDQFPPASMAAIGLPLPSVPTAVQAVGTVQLTPAKEAVTPVSKES
jgi:hypothetical protein